MRIQFIMGLVFAWFLCTLVALMMGGAWFGTTDNNIMNYLTGYSTWQAAGFFSIITVPVGFFIHGLPKLILFDYPFLQGGLSVIRYFLIAIFATGTVYAISNDFRTTLSGVFGRR